MCETVRYSRDSVVGVTMRHIPLSILWLIALPAAAQAGDHACAHVADPVARLACYDVAFPLPPEVVEAGKQQAQAGFGLIRPRDSSQESQQALEPAVPGRIESRVIHVDPGRSGLRTVTLENGQIWTQTEAHSSGNVQVGDVIQVRKGALGAYQLVTAAGVHLRVRRTR